MKGPEIQTNAPHRAAGRLIATRIPTINPTATIAEVEDLLLKKAADLETINYIYVTDGENKLIGVLSIKEVFRTPKSATVADVMAKELVTARPHTDQARVALLAIQHSLKEIPVVDPDNKFLGVVPSDTILEILQRESVENALKLAGIHRFKDPVQSLLSAGAATLFKKRLPWLLIGLGGSVVTAAIIGFFEESLKSVLLLASFIPAVTYVTDAVGTQTEAIIIRTLALEKDFRFGKYVWREIRVALGLAAMLSLTMAAISFILWRDPVITEILGISFFTAILVSMGISVSLPWLFSRAKIDPAIISGPFDTILSDLASITVYFTVATLVLHGLT